MGIDLPDGLEEKGFFAVVSQKLSLIFGEFYLKPGVPTSHRLNPKNNPACCVRLKWGKRQHVLALFPLSLYNKRMPSSSMRIRCSR